MFLLLSSVLTSTQLYLSLSTSCYHVCFSFFFFFNDTATTEIYTLSLHDALPIFFLCSCVSWSSPRLSTSTAAFAGSSVLKYFLRSEEHTSELQSLRHLVCRLLLEKKNKDCHPR